MGILLPLVERLADATGTTVSLWGGLAGGAVLGLAAARFLSPASAGPAGPAGNGASRRGQGQVPRPVAKPTAPAPAAGEEEEEGHPDRSSSDEHSAYVLPYTPARLSEAAMKTRSKEFYERMNQRRSVRHFSSDDVPQEVIDNIIRTAGTSPSGAHCEPWTFVVIRDQEIRSTIRHIVEQEEVVNYSRRMGQQWVDDLKPVGTNWEKAYLDTAPVLIIVFKQAYGLNDDGSRKAHYYHDISVSIASGLLLAAVQEAGLATLTSTPMNAGPQLRELLERPKNEKVVLLLPIGYPAADCKVPDFHRKPLEDLMVQF